MFIQPDKYVAGFKMLGLWKCNPFGATILVAFFPLSGDEREGMEDGARKRVHRLALITSRYPAAFLFRAAFRTNETALSEYYFHSGNNSADLSRITRGTARCNLLGGVMSIEE